MEKNDIVITPHYDGAGSFDGGLAIVNINHKWGYIDKSDSIVIKPQFEDTLDDFSDGIVLVKYSDKNEFVYINKTGKVISTYVRKDS